MLGMQTGVGSKYRERPLTEVYEDTATMQHWLAETLRVLAPPLHGPPPGAPQISPELQKQLDKAKQAGEQQP